MWKNSAHQRSDSLSSRRLLICVALLLTLSALLVLTISPGAAQNNPKSTIGDGTAEAAKAAGQAPAKAAAARTATPAPTAAPAGGEKKSGGLHEVKVWADRMLYDDKKQLLRLIGNVRMKEKDTTLYAPYVEFNTETEIGDITGGVKVEQPDSVLTGDRMRVFYKEKRGVVIGNVRAVTTRQPSKLKNEKARDEMKGGKTTLTCKEMEFWWEKKEGVARGNVRVDQKDKRAFADEGLYSEKSDLITLRGNVRLERGRNDWMICQEAQVDMKEETFTAMGSVEGAFLMKEGKKEKAREGTMLSPEPAPRIPEKKVKKLPRTR